MELLYSISQTLPTPAKAHRAIRKGPEREREPERVTICENSACWTWKYSCTHELTTSGCGCIHKTCTKSSRLNCSANARRAQELHSYQVTCSWWLLKEWRSVFVSGLGTRNGCSSLVQHDPILMHLQAALSGLNEHQQRHMRIGMGARTHDDRREMCGERNRRGGNVVMDLIQTHHTLAET